MHTITITNLETQSSITRKVSSTYFTDKKDAPEYVGMDIIEIVKTIDQKVEF